VAALFVEGDRAGEDAAALVLCQGDSNTFGLYLTAERSYPAKLEALMRSRGAPAARVVNRGVPGKPTWVVLSELEEDLKRYSPRAVCLLAGINNAWNVRPEVGAQGQGGSTGDPLGGLRVVKLARILLSRLGPEASGGADPGSTLVGEEQAAADNGAIWVSAEEVVRLEGNLREIRSAGRTGDAPPFLLEKGKRGEEVAAGWLEADWTAAVEMIEDAGATPILIAYPSGEDQFILLNEAVMAVAEATGARLVDPRPAFFMALESVPRSALVYEDGHPTELGYSILARLVLGVLELEGIVEEGEPLHPLELLADWSEPELELQAWCEGGELRGLEARFAPGYGAVAAYAQSPGSVDVIIEPLGKVRLAAEGEEGIPLPLAPGPLLKLSLKSAPAAPFMDEGWVQLPFPERWQGGVSQGEQLYGTVLVLGPKSVGMATSRALPLVCP